MACTRCSRANEKASPKKTERGCGGIGLGTFEKKSKGEFPSTRP